jgi:hypothetical protein
MESHGPPVPRLAFSATAHCLTGCAIGEVLGMIIGTARDWGDVPTILLSIALAFSFGYSLTLRPLVTAGVTFVRAVRVALAADTISIAVMELVDNAIIVAIPDALDAGLDTVLFWGSLVCSLVVAGTVAFPVNIWLIRRGRGHAIIHEHHGH